MPLAGRTTICGLCREKIMQGIDHYAWWLSRTVHEHCKERAAAQMAATATVTELEPAEVEEEIPLTRPRLKPGYKGRRYAATRRVPPRPADGV